MVQPASQPWRGGGRRVLAILAYTESGASLRHEMVSEVGVGLVFHLFPLISSELASLNETASPANPFKAGVTGGPLW